MRSRRSLSVALAALALSSHALVAQPSKAATSGAPTTPQAGQQQSQQPLVPALSPALAQQPAGIMVVSQNKCSMATMEQFMTWMRGTFAPAMDQAVRDGRMTSWGLLEHGWGDEWNVVMYYTARDYGSFLAGFNEAAGRLKQRDPALMQRFGGWCTEHKDSMYTVAYQMSAPAPGSR